MIQIERIPGKQLRYRIIGFGKAHNTIGIVDSLEKAACVSRFVHGANIKGAEYELAVETLREIDRENRKGDGSNDEAEP